MDFDIDVFLPLKVAQKGALDVRPSSLYVEEKVAHSKSIIFGDDGYIVPPKADWMTEEQYQLALNVYYLATWLNEKGIIHRWINTEPRAGEAKLIIFSWTENQAIFVSIKATSNRKLLKYKIIHFLNTGEWNEEEN